MVFALRSFVVWGVSPTTGGSASSLPGRNPRLQEPNSKIGNGCVARGLSLGQGARRENILHGSLTDEQRRRNGKDSQPSGLSSGGCLAALLLSHPATAGLWLCSFVAPCQPPGREQRTHSLFMRWVLTRLSGLKTGAPIVRGCPRFPQPTSPGRSRS